MYLNKNQIKKKLCLLVYLFVLANLKPFAYLDSKKHSTMQPQACMLPFQELLHSGSLLITARIQILRNYAFF